MKIRFDFKDHKSSFPIRLLQRLPFLRGKHHSTHREKVIQDIKEAINEMQLVNQGKLVARNAEDLFDEL